MSKSPFQDAKAGNYNSGPFPSKFFSACGNCGMFIDEGQQIYLVSKVAWCVTCFKHPDLIPNLNAKDPVF